MARKAPNGFGSIRKVVKAGRVYFEGRFTDPVLHKQKSISATTEAECRRKMREIQASITRGDFVTPQKQTVGAFLDDWIQGRVSIAETTRELYARNIRLYIKPRLGNIRLQELRYTHCQEWVHSLLHDPRKEHQLSAKSVRNVAGILSKALNTAVQAGLIPVNPASNLDLPRADKQPPKVMESAEQATFIAAIDKSPHKYIFLFGLYTGARISEILGLQWCNVDLKSGEVQITQQLDRKKGDAFNRELKSTKTHQARTIIVPRYVLEILKAQNILQKELKLKAGPLWQNKDGLVFTREDGSPIPHNTVANAFKRTVTKLGRPDLSFHSLRHTFITDELAAGIDVKTVSSAVGHSTATMTLDVYADATLEMKRAAADRQQARHEAKNA